MNTYDENLLYSTRDDTAFGVSFQHALLHPNAQHNGLYTFTKLPHISLEDIENFTNLTYTKLCVDIFNRLKLGIHRSVLEEALLSYKNFDDSYNPAPLKVVNENLFMLNLFSGPTRAFKDMALQPFGRLFAHLATQDTRPYLILTATSGDTGPATLQSFANQPHIRVVCIYPYGGTSDVQRLQMTTHTAPNVKVIGIEGDFDGAQSALKKLIANVDFIKKLKEQGFALSAANSVNIGRIAFQIIYYFWAYVKLLKDGHITLGEKISVVVPSGNFGNILGAFFAKKMGLPLERLVSASNANNILSDFINTGVYDISKRNLIKTKSPAMDILKSSNVERVLYALFGAQRTKQLMDSLDKRDFYSLTAEELSLLQQDFSAFECDDKMCMQSIAQGFKEGLLLDPHSAIAYFVAKNLQKSGVIGKSVFLATAEWSKFAPSVREALKEADIIKNTQEAYEISDKQAIDEICSLSCANNPIKAPDQILQLFSKKEVQQDIIPIPQLEMCIMRWVRCSLKHYS